MELGQTLFRVGAYEAALAAFRMVELHTLSREDRLLVQYLQASCLRHLGRMDEATRLYREIANSQSNAFAVECAQWQLSSLRWQQDTTRRLEQLRAWRQNREPSR
jgi:tetratricopeptide (TPR) repeat protein